MARRQHNAAGAAWAVWTQTKHLGRPAGFKQSVLPMRIFAPNLTITSMDIAAGTATSYLRTVVTLGVVTPSDLVAVRTGLRGLTVRPPIELARGGPGRSSLLQVSQRYNHSSDCHPWGSASHRSPVQLVGMPSDTFFGASG